LRRLKSAGFTVRPQVKLKDLKTFQVLICAIFPTLRSQNG
jgi:nitrate reductase NapE component